MNVRNIQLLRIFSTQKLVKINLLNYLGLQPVRILMAKALYKMRSGRMKEEFREDIEGIWENGMLQIKNFLPQEDFNKLKAECEALAANPDNFTSSKSSGPNRISMLKLRTLPEDKYPEIYKFLNNERIKAIFSSAERRDIDPTNGEVAVLLELLEQDVFDGEYDYETDLHSDTFFNTHKSWLYMTDVEMEHGPLVYVKKTHRLDITKRLGKEYKYSFDHVNNTGSRRIPKEELESLGIQETILATPKNTFVMANTHGYHRRMKGMKGKKRLSLVVSARKNPFLP